MRDACSQWARDARAGVVTTRSRDLYKPGAVRSYEQSLQLRVLDELGDRRLHEVRRIDLQRLVNRLVAEGHAPSDGGQRGHRDARGLQLRRPGRRARSLARQRAPATRSRRERFATPSEAAALLSALPAKDQAIWATALYAGLRRAEIMALRWECIDFAAGTIEVRQSWDIEHGPQDTKSRNRRRVPIPTTLREHLLAHKLRQPPGAATSRSRSLPVGPSHPRR